MIMQRSWGFKAGSVTLVFTPSREAAMGVEAGGGKRLEMRNCFGTISKHLEQRQISAVRFQARPGI